MLNPVVLLHLTLFSYKQNQPFQKSNPNSLRDRKRNWRNGVFTMNSSHCRRNVEEKMKSEEMGLRFKNPQWQREISKSSWIYGLLFSLSDSLTLTQLSHCLTLRLAIWNSSQLLIIYRENFTFCFMIALGFFFSFLFLVLDSDSLLKKRSCEL